MLLRLGIAAADGFAFHDRRQQGITFIRLPRHIAFGCCRPVLFPTFAVGPQKAVEIDGGTGRLERRASSLHRDRAASLAGVGHLTGDGAFPDQVVELPFIGLESVFE